MTSEYRATALYALTSAAEERLQAMSDKCPRCNGCGHRDYRRIGRRRRDGDRVTCPDCKGTGERQYEYVIDPDTNEVGRVVRPLPLPSPFTRAYGASVYVEVVEFVRREPGRPGRGVSRLVPMHTRFMPTSRPPDLPDCELCERPLDFGEYGMHAACAHRVWRRATQGYFT